MNRHLLRLRRSRPVRALSKYSRRTSLPGFGGHSLYEVTKFFVYGLQQGSVQARAAAMAFSFFLALFPTMLFLFTLIPYVPIKDFQDIFIEHLHSILPKNIFLLMQDALVEIVRNQNGKILSVGIIAALYFSTNGFHAMFGAFNKSIHIRETRPWWRQRLVALLMGLILAVLLIAGMAIVVGTELILPHLFHKSHSLSVTIIIGRWLGLAILTVLVISFFYNLGPARRVHWNFINPGAILATTLIVLTSVLFTWYVNHFASYNRVYGSIGTVIVVMLFIYYNSMMILIGFELNASISEARAKHKELEMPKKDE